MYGGLEPPILVSSKGNNSESQTYSWQIQHPGRPSLKNVETCSDRMVSQSDNSQSGLFNDGVSQHRSVCDSSRQQTSNVCVTYSRQQSSGNRRTVSQLGSYPRICISPVSRHSCHSEQDSSVSVQDCPSSSFMAPKVMVSGSAATSSCSSLKIMSQYDTTFDLKINVGHCDLYFMVH